MPANPPEAPRTAAPDAPNLDMNPEEVRHRSALLSAELLAQIALARVLIPDAADDEVRMTEWTTPNGLRKRFRDILTSDSELRERLLTDFDGAVGEIRNRMLH